MLVTEREGRLRIVRRTGKLDPAPVAGVPEVVAARPVGAVRRCPAIRATPRIISSASPTRRAATAGSAPSSRAARLGGRAARGRQGHLPRRARRRAASIHSAAASCSTARGTCSSRSATSATMERAQRPDDDAGSVIRLNDDGSVPKDNPFVGKPGWKPEKSRPRPSQPCRARRSTRQTGALWTHEHGPQGGDEINIIRPGRNYGWPVITYGVELRHRHARSARARSKPGMEQPLYYWVPSIAPSGMAVLHRRRFPKWKGNLFVGALKSRCSCACAWTATRWCRKSAC